MFDVGFSEMMIIAVVALVVIGPERLPRVARTLGHLIGRMQRYVNDVKADINREIELDELRKFKDQFQDAAHDVETSIRSGMDGARTEMNAVEGALTSKNAGTPEITAGPENTAASGNAGHNVTDVLSERAPESQAADEIQMPSPGASAPSSKSIT